MREMVSDVLCSLIQLLLTPLRPHQIDAGCIQFDVFSLPRIFGWFSEERGKKPIYSGWESSKNILLHFGIRIGGIAIVYQLRRTRAVKALPREWIRICRL